MIFFPLQKLFGRDIVYLCHVLENTEDFVLIPSYVKEKIAYCDQAWASQVQMGFPSTSESS